MSAEFTNVNASGVTVQDTFVPDKLLDRDTRTRKITVKSGGGALARGTLLGKVTKGSAVAAAKAGGNTGNGTISAVTAITGEKVGVYTVRFTAATVFTVEDPDGFVLAINGATSVAFADDLGFTITAGGTPFVAGDGFDITVGAGSGKYLKSLAAAVDGSEVPDAILLEPVDATSADVDGAAAISGRFNQNAVVFGAGHTAASADAVLRGKGIFLENTIG